ncbi:MAG: SLC26A/SulP transporter family protein [Kofleriaceae bacterium]|nr:SLC26A/SulP transporter family protein [Kofleriaceae bacterium]
MLFGGRVQRGDLYGGLTAAVIALPLAIAFGVASMASLGPEHASTGALVGLLGAIFTGFFAAYFGGTPSQVTGPTGPMTAVVTLFVASSMVGRTSADVPLVMTLTGLAVALGGALQIGIGWIGGGRLVKYIPYPVIAGFMNGIAVIIFLGQLKPFLGITGAFSEFDIATGWVPIALGTVTILAIVLTKRVSKSIPGSLVGLFVGIATYIVIALLGYAPLRADDNPLLIGPVPNPFTSIDHVPLFQLGSLGDISPLDLKRVFSTAITIGVLGSIDSLLTSVIADAMTNTRHDSRKELIGQGIGNAVSGLLGGIAGAGATVRTLVNINAGGRTRHSGMIHAGVIFIVVLALGWPAGWIPQATLAGILFVTAYGIIDRYSLGLFRRRLVRNEFVLMLVVAGVTVVIDLMIAVAVGIAAAAMFFILQQAKIGVAVRRLRGDVLFSRRTRPPSHMRILAKDGAGTIVYQIRGALFFGTVDAVQNEIENDSVNAKRVIFHLARVRDIDLTGVQLLLQVVGRFRERGIPVAISGLTVLQASRPGLHKMLVELGVYERLGQENVHVTLDRALEAFEDQLLAEHGAFARAAPLELDGFDHLAELAPAHRAQVAGLVIPRELTAGEVLFAQGEPADAIAFVRSGRLSLVTQNGVDETRVAVFGSGDIYGARAVFDGATWPSVLRAEEPTAVFVLPQTAVAKLRAEQPRVLEGLERCLLKVTVTRMDAMRAELVLLEDG